MQSQNRTYIDYPSILACLHEQIIANNCNAVYWLSFYYPELIDEKDSLGTSGLHKATKNGSAKMVRLLLDLGCNADIQDADGNTCLHVAVAEKNPDMLKLLLVKKANPNIYNNKKNTPLLDAVNYEEHILADMLLEYGANINAKDKDGDTPLHIAAILDHIPSVIVLVQNKANVFEKNNAGLTTIEVAMDNKCYDLISILVSAGEGEINFFPGVDLNYESDIDDNNKTGIDFSENDVTLAAQSSICYKCGTIHSN